VSISKQEFAQRIQVLSSLPPSYLTVHQRGRSEADVTEGSGGIWERPALRLVRAQPCHPQDDRLQRVGGASGHACTFTRQPNGTTDIDVVVVREGKNLKGWLLGLVVGIIGRRVLEKAFENSVKAIPEIRRGPLPIGWA
jgi:hypothetical protein